MTFLLLHPLRAVVFLVTALAVTIAVAGPVPDPTSSQPKPQRMLPSTPTAVQPASATELVADRRGYFRFEQATVSLDWLWLLTEARRAGWHGTLDGPMTALRSRAEQRQLHKLFLAGRGAPAFAPDGPSRHLMENVRAYGGWYHAADVTRPVGLIRHARRLGVRLHRPYPDEPWHVEADPFSAPADWTAGGT